MLPLDMSLDYSLAALRTCAAEIAEAELTEKKIERLAAMLATTIDNLTDARMRLHDQMQVRGPKPVRGRVEDRSDNVVRVSF